MPSGSAVLICRLMDVLSQELFVIAERMRTYDERAHSWIVRQRDGNGRGLTTPGALLIDEVAHGA